MLYCGILLYILKFSFFVDILIYVDVLDGRIRVLKLLCILMGMFQSTGEAICAGEMEDGGRSEVLGRVRERDIQSLRRGL